MPLLFSTQRTCHLGRPASPHTWPKGQSPRGCWATSHQSNNPTNIGEGSIRPVNAASSTGRCNTIQCIDSTILGR
jgi:hypothetical protein